MQYLDTSGHLNRIINVPQARLIACSHEEIKSLAGFESPWPLSQGHSYVVNCTSNKDKKSALITFLFGNIIPKVMARTSLDICLVCSFYLVCQRLNHLFIHNICWHLSKAPHILSVMSADILRMEILCKYKFKIGNICNVVTCKRLSRKLYYWDGSNMNRYILKNLNP